MTSGTEEEDIDEKDDRAYRDYLIENKFENDKTMIEINKRLSEMLDEDKQRILNYIKYVEHERRML